MLDVVCRRAALAILSAVVLACFLPLQVSASTAVVTPPGTTACKNLTTFNTISGAVTAVPSGSTIYICPGTYMEQVTIAKSMTLTGVSSVGTSGATALGANNPVVASPANGVIVNASDLLDGSGIAAQIAVISPVPATPITVTLNNIAVDGTNNGISGCAPDLVGIYYQNANGTVNHVVTRFQELAADLFGCQVGLGIYAQSGYATSGTSTITIENNSVHDYQKNGITVDGNGMNATVTANYVVGIGATTQIAQNGIQVSDSANGKVTNNTVTDDVYVNPPDCVDNGGCASATGILLYDSGGTSGKPLPVTGNTVSNAQGGVVAYGQVFSAFSIADYNVVTGNKITTSPAAGPYQLDGIDLCSNNNTATGNTVFNSSGSGVHIDSSCVEGGGATGTGTTVSSNTINEACAGVLTGNNSGNNIGTNTSYNAVQVSFSGDSCPIGAPGHAKSRLKPQAWHP